MKKFIIIITLLFSFSSIKAQVIHDSLSEDVIKNAPYILEGKTIKSYVCNCISNEYYDLVFKLELSVVLKGKDIQIGDTINVLIPRVGYGIKGHLIDPPKGDASRFSYSDGGGLFLTKYNSTLKVKEEFFVLYPSQSCSCYLTSYIKNEIRDYDVVALNGLKFKTKQDWYIYLKQFPDIKIPGEK